MSKNYNSTSPIVWLCLFKISNINNIEYALIIGIRKKKLEKIYHMYTIFIINITCYK